MPLLLVNNEELLHFQNLEEAEFWIDMQDPSIRNNVSLIPMNRYEEEEIEGFLDDFIEIIPK